MTIGSHPVDSFLLGRTAACLVKKDAGAKQSQSYLIHFYTDVYLHRYARSSLCTMFFVEVGLISFTFTLTSIQVGMLAPLVIGPGGLFLNTGMWVRLHPSHSLLVLGDCFLTPACGCACTPPAHRWVWGIVSRCQRVGALAPLPLVVGSGGLFLDAGMCGCACTPPTLCWVWGIVCRGASVCSLQPAVLSKSKSVSCFIFPLTSMHRIARSFQSGAEDLY